MYAMEIPPKLIAFARPGVCQSQRGATLIEVLVAVVLLSVGLVGLAGLQYNGTKFNHSAYLRSQATALAYDAIERVRANLAACPSSDAALCAYLTDQAAVFDGDANEECNRAVNSGGDAAAMAASEINQWKHCLESTLPQGRGRIAVVADGAAYQDQCLVNHSAPVGRDIFMIEVNWAEARVAAGPNQVECLVVRAEMRPM